MRICIIKLGAKGDVVRTTPIAEALKNKYPNCKITWITKANSVPLLKGDKFIDEIYELDNYKDEYFDEIYNFDIDNEACWIATRLKGNKKYGFYQEGGYASAFNFGAEYYLSTLFDDKTKKTNTKSYQQMMFSVAELIFNKEKCYIPLTKKGINYGNDYIKRNKIEGKKIIGIHMGASPRWPSKVWHMDCISEFTKLAKENGYTIILFGGQNEKEKLNNLLARLKNNKIEVLINDVNNTDEEFIGLVNICNYMVCSDSFSLHVSIALEKPTIGLFFCTSPEEIEGYGVLYKVISKRLYEFFPERMNEYDEELTKSISPTDVMEIIKNINTKK